MVLLVAGHANLLLAEKYESLTEGKLLLSCCQNKTKDSAGIQGLRAYKDELQSGRVVWRVVYSTRDLAVRMR